MIEENINFELKDETKIHRALKKILTDTDDCLSESKALKLKELAVMDACNVCMIIAKTKRAINLLRRYHWKELDFPKVPELSYSDSSDGVKSKFSVEYMKLIMDFFNAQNEAVWILNKKDYPLTIYNDDFKVILAPRVDTF